MSLRPYILVLTAALVAAWVGCGQRTVPPAADQRLDAGSRDGRYRYLLDAAAELLVVREAATSQELARIAVGRAPERLVVGADEAIYVVNRGSRSVSVIHPGEWTEARRLPAGVEPVALEVSLDNRLLYVVNASALDSDRRGALTAVDLAEGKVLWELALEGNPMGIALEGSLARVRLAGDRQVLVDLVTKAQIAEPAPPPDPGPEPRTEAPAQRRPSLVVLGTLDR